MGRKRIELQFKYAADNVFHEHMDKHAIKKEEGFLTSPRIFSYAQKKNLLGFSDTLCKWIETTYGKPKYVRDITHEMVNGFMAEKVEKCSSATIAAYKSYVKKWEIVLENVYHIKLDWTKNLVVPERMTKEDAAFKRIQQMERPHFESIMEKASKSRSTASLAFEISARFGARVAGTVSIKAKDVFLDGSGHWRFGRIRLQEKGGRTRYVDIKTESDRDFIKDAVAALNPEDKLVPIKKDSVNRQLNRIMTELGLKKLYKNTGMHSIRKMYAQETYNQARTSGMDKKQAIRYVNDQLGHGKDRDNRLIAVYVKNIW